MVVDDEVAFIGGYSTGSLGAAQRRDTHLRASGPAERWRYTAELLADIESAGGEHLEQAMEFQLVLGQVQDALITREFLREHADPAPPAPVVCVLLTARRGTSAPPGPGGWSARPRSARACRRSR